MVKEKLNMKDHSFEFDSKGKIQVYKNVKEEKEIVYGQVERKDHELTKETSIKGILCILGIYAMIGMFFMYELIENNIEPAWKQGLIFLLIFFIIVCISFMLVNLTQKKYKLVEIKNGKQRENRNFKKTS